MSDVDKAYMAGFFDGEGCIGLYRRGSWSLQVTIAQNSTEVLNDFNTAFLGGNWNSRPRCQCITWYGLTGEPLVRDLYPFLRVKQEQAELALRWCDLVKDRKKGQPYTALESEYMIDLATRIKELKKPVHERAR